MFPMQPMASPGRSLRFLVAAVLCIAFLAASSTPRAASDLERPRGQVLLTVTGDIARRNSADGAQFDRAMLDGLGSATLRTSTPWTEDVAEFWGVPVRAVLDRVGARGTSVRAVAFNDYAIDIPISDFRDYPVLLAAEQDGRRLTARDKGPLWIVYPLDDMTDGRNRLIERKMVWQLVELHVQ